MRITFKDFFTIYCSFDINIFTKIFMIFLYCNYFSISNRIYLGTNRSSIIVTLMIFWLSFVISSHRAKFT